MKFLTDENIALSVMRFIRQKGFDVKDIKEESLQGSSDKDVLMLAKKEKRIILTHDKDFLEIVKSDKTEIEGIILIKCKKQNPENISATLGKLMDSSIIKKIRNNLVILNEKELLIIER